MQFTRETFAYFFLTPCFFFYTLCKNAKDVPRSMESAAGSGRIKEVSAVRQVHKIDGREYEKTACIITVMSA